MKKNIKVICVLFVILTIFSIISQVYAATICTRCGGDGSIGGFIECRKCDGSGMMSEITHSADDVIDGADEFISIGEPNASDKIAHTDLKDMSDTLYNILLVVGMITAVIVGLIMGIKFILGGLEEKAEIKNMMMPYIIGCGVVFGAFTIWKIIVDILQTM